MELAIAPTDGLATQEALEERLIADWLARNDSPHTRRAYARTLSEFCEFVGGKPLMEVSTHDVQGYKDVLAARLKPAAVNQRLATVKSLFSYCNRAASGVFRANVGALVKLVKVPDKLAERLLPTDDVLKIIALEPDGRNHALLSTLYYTGARVSEVCRLTWADLQPRDPSTGSGAGQVTLCGKGGKTRVVKIPAKVWTELMRLKDTSSPCDPVFRSRKGGHLDPSQVKRIVERAAVRAGLAAKVSPHFFRHAHASHALDAGAPVHVVKDTLGHSSLATTSRYSHARHGVSSSDYLV